MNKMKYVSGLKLICFLGKCSRYMYYAKKVLCICFVILVACLGVSIFSNGKIGIKALKEML